MKRFRKPMVAVLVGLGSLSGLGGELLACGGAGGRSIGSFGGAYRPRPSYQRPAYVQPRQISPVQVSGGANPLFPHVNQAAPQQLQQQPFAGAPSGSPQVNAQPQQQQGFAQQQQSGAPSSALESLGGMPAQASQPAQRVAARPVQPQAAQPQPQQVQQVQQPQQVQQDPMAEIEQSALQALADMNEEAATPAAGEAADNTAPATDHHIGQWKATLGNGSTVELTLAADGAFVWVANSNGKTSSFQGSYTVDGQSLTLVRSSDNQKLAGTLTAINGGMNFKQHGGKDAGLNFVRS